MKRTPAEERITDLIERIEAITLETQDITRELRQLQEQQLTTGQPNSVTTEPSEPPSVYTPTATAIPQENLPRSPATTHDFHIGDRAIITNSYLGKKGTSGVVIAISPKQVTIRDKNGRSHKRKHTNLRHEQL